MSRYFFSITDGTRIMRDREGTEFSGLDEVHKELVDFGLRVLKHRFTYGIDDPSRWSIRVSNEDQLILTDVPLDKLSHRTAA